MTKVAAEFAVIVVGVLTALSVDSYRDHRVDRGHEAAYLEQIREDSRYNLERIAESVEMEQRHSAVAEVLLEALQAPSAPSVDSIRTWLGRRNGSWWISDPRLLDGTINALIETGDLNLITDVRVRSAILRYQGHIRADSEAFQLLVQVHIDAGNNLNLSGARNLTHELAPEEERETRRILAMYGDPFGEAAMEQLGDGYSERLWYLDQMRLATESLLEALR